MPLRPFLLLLTALAFTVSSHAQINRDADPLDEVTFGRFGGDATYVTAPDPRLDFGTKGTIEFWLTWQRLGDQPACIVSNADAGATRFSVCIDAEGRSIGLLVDGQLHSVPMDFRDGEKHFVVLTTGDQRTDVTVDGTFRGFIRQGYGAATRLPLHVGSHGGTAYPFAGTIGNLRIWRTMVDEKTAQSFRFEAADRSPVSIVGHPNFVDLVAYSDFHDTRQPKMRFREGVEGLWVEQSRRLPQFLKLPNVAADTFAANNHGNYRKATMYWMQPVDRATWFVYRDGEYYGALNSRYKGEANEYTFVTERRVGDEMRLEQAQFRLVDGELVCDATPTALFGLAAGSRIRLMRPSWQDQAFREEVVAEIKEAQFLGITQLFSCNYRSYNLKKMDPFNLINSGSNTMAFRPPAARFRLLANKKYAPIDMLVQFRNEGGGGSESVLCRTAEDLAESMGIRAGISTGVQVANFGGGLKANGRLNTEATIMESKETMKLLAWGVSLNYDMVADFSRVELSDELRDQVAQLLRTEDFTTFFDQAGTHYAHAVSYGGMIFYESNLTRQAYNRSNMENWDIEGEINGGGGYGPVAVNGSLSAGFGEGTTEGFQEMMETQESKFFVVGGDGALGASAENLQIMVGENVAPVYLDLRPIHELLSPQFFDDPRVYHHLRARMATEMNRYLGVYDQKENTATPDPLVFATVETQRVAYAFPLTFGDYTMTASSGDFYSRVAADRAVLRNELGDLPSQSVKVGDAAIKAQTARQVAAFKSDVALTAMVITPLSALTERKVALDVTMHAREWHADPDKAGEQLLTQWTFSGATALPPPKDLDKQEPIRVSVPLSMRLREGTTAIRNPPVLPNRGTVEATVTYRKEYEGRYLQQMRERLKTLRASMDDGVFARFEADPPIAAGRLLVEQQLGATRAAVTPKRPGTSTVAPVPPTPTATGPRSLWYTESMVVGGRHFPSQPVLLSMTGAAGTGTLQDAAGRAMAVRLIPGRDGFRLQAVADSSPLPLLGVPRAGADGSPSHITWRAQGALQAVPAAERRQQIAAATAHIMQFDTDRDGVISRHEAATFPDEFAALDADRDGRVTRTELAASEAVQSHVGPAEPPTTFGWQRWTLAGDWRDAAQGVDIAITQDGDRLHASLSNDRVLVGRIAPGRTVSLGDGLFVGTPSDDMNVIQFTNGVTWLRMQDGRPVATPAPTTAPPTPAAPAQAVYGDWHDVQNDLGISIRQEGSQVHAVMNSPHGRQFWRTLDGQVQGDTIAFRMPDGRDAVVRITDSSTLTWENGLVWRRLPAWLSGTWIDPDGGSYTIDESRVSISIALITDTGTGTPVTGTRDGLTIHFGESQVQLNAAQTRLTWPSGRVFIRVPDISGTWVDANARIAFRITQDRFQATVRVLRGDAGWTELTGQIIDNSVLRFDFRDGPVDVAISDGRLQWPAGGPTWLRR